MEEQQPHLKNLIARVDRVHESPPEMSRGLALTMAAACGVIVANLYYNQPLLAQMARTFHVEVRQIAFIPTLTQAGYATGLLLLVPLGDTTERRRLILAMLSAVTVCLVGAAMAPALWALVIAHFFIGVLSVVAQILIPLAVQLSPNDQRGRTVGTLMSGLLLGILLSRTASGFVAEAWGWRAMYWIAAVLMLPVAAMLRLRLPNCPPRIRLPYGRLLRSVVQLVRDQPVLREASASGALLFGTFSVFWATLIFLLESPAYQLGPRAAGLFGLAGAAGTLAAPIAGRLADRRSPRFLVGAATLLVLLTWGVFRMVGLHLWGLVLGVVLLDLGVQAAQVSNQARVYSLDPEAHSRLNTAYMVSYFVGGAAGSILGAHGWSSGGWHGVCLAGSAFVIAALFVHATCSMRSQPTL